MAAAAQLGPFFHVGARPGPGWASWAALSADPELLGRRAAEVRAVLAAGPGNPEVEPAVVASLVHLGLVARLVSPLLGAALLTGVLPVAPVEHVHVRLAGANPIPLAVAATSAAVVGSAAELAAAFDRSWLVPVIEPLTRTVRARWTVSRQVLDGNVASAVAGALRMAPTARPELAGRADATLDALLRSGPLAGTGRRRSDGSFVRRSCCLFYRVPGGGTCGDCVLDDRGLPPGAAPV
jgi:ferric iron reductase protein FhuF